jgi:glycerophosphoryl diester phosphodiesterase
MTQRLSATFDLQGHRGCRGLRPENTLVAYRHALALGVSTLEMDCAVTADGVPVMSHDPSLNPDLTRGPDGAWIAPPGLVIVALHAEHLRLFDVGRPRPGSAQAARWPEQVAVDGTTVPTLAEVADLVRASSVPVGMNIETKLFPDQPGLTVSPAAMASAILAVLDAAGLTARATIQSFDWRSLDWLAANRPEVARSYLTTAGTLRPAWLGGREVAGRKVPQLVAAAGGRIWSPDFTTLTREEVALARELGLAVLPWTVNRPEDMARLLDWAVDGIITDYPDRLRQVMAARGIPLPPAAS